MVLSSVINFLQELDQSATLFLNNLDSPISDQFWQFMSDKSVWIPAYAICVFLLFKRLGWKKALVVIVSAAVSFGLCDQLSNFVKGSVLRLRPLYNSRMLLGGLNVLESRGGTYGFFSAHAANAFALAFCLIIGFRNDTSHTYNVFYKGALLWASLVAASRIFVGKHFLGDVLVGMLVGILIGYFVGMTARYLIQKYLDKVPTTGLTMIFDKSLRLQLR